MAEQTDGLVTVAVMLECGCVPVMKIHPRDVLIRAVCRHHGDRVVVEVSEPLEYEL